MDFGWVGFDGLMGSDSGFSSLASDPETKQKWHGAGLLKQQRSGNSEDDLRSSKLAKTDDFSASKAMLLQQKNALLRSSCTLFSDGLQQQQMLSFSSPKSEVLVAEKNSQNAQALSAYTRNTGYSSGSLDGSSVHGFLAGARGPFTPSQWMELEHQALIYKYITANMPVPSNLLIPIRKSLDSVGFSTFPGGLLRPSTLGWGSFHLGFSNNTDPEPGRCRRTDGKKWRCSRDAVVDQKYCERHMNRGRHRSRKPVEGQTGHAITGTTSSTSSTNSKLMPIASSTSASAVVVPSSGGGGTSNSLATANQPLKHLPHDASNPSAATTNRMFVNKDNMGERMQDQPGLSMLSPASIDQKPKESSFTIQKQKMTYEQPSRNEVSDRGAESQQSLRHFIDDWPKAQADRSAISWPEMGMRSDRTQLSISIPLASSDLISSTCSPANEKLTLAPLRLSMPELDPIKMGLGVGSSGVLNEPNQRQANWIPISWETSMGGPLGEVVHHGSNSSATDCKNSSALNLMTAGWDNSPPVGSSPTGVLQKTAFGSLSNSSAGSSPRAENHKTVLEGAGGQCNDPLGSQLL
ncbi:growth-regulating factor 6-like isoform X2 [Juglans microcarpa x Juglans regia]|uniref:growth-regulating factor 6-like isoform X2 n=1 Tax=Juglans microcarpa x Juglans regia TaxID=2249226 RepID=UPI001B7E0094|nr:growth-regulating factor 6-like isoform X2 [Juglans microcarpa x Juglans regia]